MVLRFKYKYFSSLYVGEKLFDTNNVKKGLQFFQLFTVAIEAA